MTESSFLKAVPLIDNIGAVRTALKGLTELEPGSIAKLSLISSNGALFEFSNITPVLSKEIHKLLNTFKTEQLAERLKLLQAL